MSTTSRDPKGLRSMPITVPVMKENPGRRDLSRREKKGMHTQARSLRRMAVKLIRNTSVLQDSGASLADQPITATGWMGLDAHHRNVKDFEKAWERGQGELYAYLKGFRPVSFEWIDE
jgi:hypothetical protein